MSEEEAKKENNAVKMHRLRRTLDRLRNIRSSGKSSNRKKSWLERLKIRLGLGGNAEE